VTVPHERRDVQREKAAEAGRLFRMAYALQMDGDLDRALILYEKSVRLHATAEAHTYLGWAKSTRGLLDEAIAHCTTAIGLSPEFLNAWNDIGAYLIEQGEPGEALFFLKRATRLKRQPTQCFPHYNLHRAYLALGDKGRAIDELAASLDADPEFQPASEALAHLFQIDAKSPAHDGLSSALPTGSPVLSFPPR
jgi:tetratricopeptide (TPR) repeat protein